MRKLLLVLLSLCFQGQAQPEAEVGRLLMLSFWGSEPPLEVLHGIQPGGFIFFARNMPDVSAARYTTRALQDAAAYPLLFATDQEGGPFTSLRTGATFFPGNMALAATGEPQLAREVARATALELAHAGLNMNFAPVVDVQTNPDNPIIGIRSFGAEVEAVSRFGRAFLAGLEEAGVAAVAKHFPGHGDTNLDSHLALPSVSGDRARLDAIELPPFQALIGAGVPAIMTAHVAFGALEPDVPATLSAAALTGLLRHELGFDGLVITDYMDMQAVAEHYGPGEAAVLSVLAGADLVLLGPDPAVQREVHRALQEAVASGRIGQERLQEALGRVALVAARYPARWDEPPPDYAAHAALALEVAARGATLLSNDGILPLDPAARVLVVAPQPSAYGLPPHLGEVLARHHGNVISLLVDERPTAAQIAEALDAAEEADVLVLGSYFWLGGYPIELQALGQALMQTRRPLVLVSLGNPDDLRFLAAPPQAYLAVYGYREANLEAAALLLTGQRSPQGRLPVPVAGYPTGYGLEDY